VTGQPVVTEVAVYTTSSKAVRALDRESGETRWKLDDGTPEVSREPGEQLPPRITIQDETVYANAGTLYALSLDGSIDWQYDLTTAYSVAPTVADGLVIGCRNNVRITDPDQYELIALDAETGEVVWTAERDERIKTKPVVADGVIHINEPFEDAVDAYDLETGEPRETDSPAAAQTDDDNTASRSSSDGLGFTIDGNEVKVLKDGETQWSFDTGDIQQIDYDVVELQRREWIVHKPVVDGDTVFIGCVQWDQTKTPPHKPPTDDTLPLGVGPVLTGVAGFGLLAGRLLQPTDEND